MGTDHKYTLEACMSKVVGLCVMCNNSDVVDNLCQWKLLTFNGWMTH